jgi:DNA-directed RNA polymerase subunit L
MEIKIVKEEKNTLDIELSSLTIAELLRAYMVNEGVDVVAWKRDNPNTNPVLHIEGATPKKALSSAIAKIEKEVDSAVSEFKKLK